MTIKEWIKKDEVMNIIKGLPQDLWEEYIYMLKGVWCDEDMHIETLQAEPKQGEWVSARIGETTSWYVECSECHVVMPPVNYSYCPNCGAKMDKE